MLILRLSVSQLIHLKLVRFKKMETALYVDYMEENSLTYKSTPRLGFIGFVEYCIMSFLIKKNIYIWNFY